MTNAQPLRIGMFVMPEIFLAKVLGLTKRIRVWPAPVCLQYHHPVHVADRVAQPFDWAVSRNVFVADSTDEARRIATANSLGSCIQYILDLTRATAPTGVSMWKRDASQSNSDCNLDYFLDEVVIAGDPAIVASELLQLRERIGPFGSLVLVAHDWDDRQRWLHSLELFATEVVPRFNAVNAATQRGEAANN